MNFIQPTLRSFVNTDGKLVLCNELFFHHFGHCTQHLIGKSVHDVFSAAEESEVLEAIQNCQLHPGQCFTVEMEKSCKEGCRALRWEVYAETNRGKLSGIHVIGCFLRPGVAASEA